MNKTITVQTQCVGNTMRFIQRGSGKAIDHTPEFMYNGREYYFLGGFYYDIEPDLLDYIFN